MMSSMKKIFAYFTLAALTAALTACIEDSRDNFMVEDMLSLVYEDPVTPASVYAGTCTVAVLKSGKGKSAGKAVVGTSSGALAAYNLSEEATAAYSALDASNFTFSDTELHFQASDLRKTFTVNWDPDQVVPLLDSDLKVLPVVIVEGSLPVNEDRDLLMINLLKSTVSFAAGGSTVLAKETATEDGEVRIKVKLDRTIPKDMTITITVDNSLVAAYNAAKGTDYPKAPDGYAALPAEPVTIAKDDPDTYFTLSLKTSKLFGTDGKMMDFKTLVVPLRITATSINGVEISDQAYYLLVNSPFAGATFSRIWGKYSIDKLWTQGYADIPDGGDRTLATDGTWVYFPYAIGGSTAKITAISVNDPDITKQVNFTGATANTITSACVRVIDKGNGSPMLIASGANASEFAFYAWENGIDSAPTKWGLKCSWRRHGDRIEYHGTWADGQLWAHSYQGTFDSYYEFKDGKFVDLDPKNGHLLADVPYEGFGGLYRYPGSDELLFASSDWGAFVTPTGSTRIADVFTVKETTREDYAAATLSFGYTVFTFRGDTYVAYTSFDNDEINSQNNPYPSKLRARLTVLEGQGNWRKTVGAETRKVIFEAPLQGENFEDKAKAVPTSAQGDCSVRVMGDHVIIAAGAQGIGASVFKME